MNSRITGPSPLPLEVQQALMRPMISHRSDEFKTTVGNVRDGLSKLMGAQQVKPLMFTSSGTAAMESTLLNLVKSSDKILSLSVGYYGDMYCKMARQFFPNAVKALRFEDGSVVCVQQLADILSSSEFDVVLVTHNESATGTLQPLRIICEYIRAHSDALILVDAVSSIGCTEFDFDDWKIDAAVTVPQKGLMAPPGLSIVALSPRALLKAGSKGTIGSIAFDFVNCHRLLESNMVITTPSLHSMWGLEAALRIIEQCGLDKTFERHRLLSEMSVNWLKTMGLAPLPVAQYTSPALTAFRLPATVSSSTVVSRLSQQYQINVGQLVGDDKELGLRVGHMGDVEVVEVNDCFTALKHVLEDLL